MITVKLKTILIDRNYFFNEHNHDSPKRGLEWAPTCALGHKFLD